MEEIGSVLQIFVVLKIPVLESKTRQILNFAIFVQHTLQMLFYKHLIIEYCQNIFYLYISIWD